MEGKEKQPVFSLKILAVFYLQHFFTIQNHKDSNHIL